MGSAELDVQPISFKLVTSQQSDRRILMHHDDIRIASPRAVDQGNATPHKALLEKSTGDGTAIVPDMTIPGKQLGTHRMNGIPRIIFNVSVGNKQIQVTVGVNVLHHGPKPKSRQRRLMKSNHGRDVAKSYAFLIAV